MEIFTVKNKKPKIAYTGYELYLKTLVEFSSKKIGKIDPKDKKFVEFYKNLFFGPEGPKRFDLPPKKWTRIDEIFSKIFYGFNEIRDSYENLRDCEIYVKQYPNYPSFKKRKITRVKYLRYHIEKYFNEIYILKLRIEAYANIIKKYFRNDTRIGSIVDKLKKYTFAPFGGIIDTRGHHVHVSRYRDQDLDRLSSLELLNSVEKPNPFLIMYVQKIVYPQLRNEWVKKIKENNKATKKILDIYFDCMIKIVFDKRGDLKIE